MAWVSIGTGSTGAYPTADQASMVHTLGANGIAAGNFAVVLFAQHNGSTIDSIDSGSVTTVNDAAGNTWLKAKEWQRGVGAAGGGIICSLWYTNATSALSSATGTITATLIPGSTVFDGGASLAWIYSVDGPAYVLNSTALANSSSVPGLIDLAVGTTGPYLRVRGLSHRSTIVAALTTSAGWTGMGVARAGVANDTAIRGEFIITASSTAASSPTVSGEVNGKQASVYVIFAETSPAVGEAIGDATADAVSPAGTAVGSAQGDADASGITCATALSDGAATGDAAASGILVATALFDGSAQGDADASALSAASALSVGAAQGDAAADAVGTTGIGTVTGDGAASGDAAASAEGASLFSADGAIAGDADAAAIGDGAFPADGLAQGDATASAEGAEISTGPAQGFAQGDSEASAVSSGEVTGEAIGDAEADAVSAATALSVGAAQGDAAAQATAFGDAPMAGTATGDSDANAIAGGSVGLATGDAVAAAFSNILVASAGLAEGDAEALAIAEGGASGTAIGDSIASAVGFSFIAPQQRGIITHSVTQISAAKARSSLRGTGTVISRVF